MNAPEDSSLRPATVFVSYARENITQANEIAAGLRFAGFDVTIDENSIEKGEAWRAQLERLILSADTVVCLLSPAFAASEICGWEIDFAISRAKRILPVLVEPAAGLRAELEEINWVRLDGGRSFMAGLEHLNRSLKLDLDWVRQHTRLQQRALEWIEADRAENRLIRGEDIKAARQLLARANKDLPPVTDMQRDFIQASEEADARLQSLERQRLESMRRAQSRFAWALAAAALAVTAGLGLGISQARMNSENETRVQAGFADLQLREGRYGSVMRISVARLQSGASLINPWPNALENRLRLATALNPHLATGSIESLRKNVDQFSAHFDLVAQETSQLTKLVDTDPGAGVLNRAVRINLTSPDRQRRLVIDQAASQLSLVALPADDAGETPRLDLEGHQGLVTAAAFSPDSKLLATASDAGELMLWASDTGSLMGRLEASVDGLVFSHDGQYLRTRAGADGPFSVFELHNLLSAVAPNASAAEAYIARNGDGVILRRLLRDEFRLHAPRAGVFRQLTGVTKLPESARFEVADPNRPNAPPLTFSAIDKDLCPHPSPDRAPPAAWQSLTASARDWGAHPELPVLALVSPDEGSLTIHGEDGQTLLDLSLGRREVLDAKFSCDGRYLYSVDEAGRFLKWRLAPLLDVAPENLTQYACNGSLYGASSLAPEEERFARNLPCRS